MDATMQSLIRAERWVDQAKLDLWHRCLSLGEQRIAEIYEATKLPSLTLDKLQCEEELELLIFAGRVAIREATTNQARRLLDDLADCDLDEEAGG